MVSGLPVTTPSTEWPLFIEYVSKIQAISRGLGADVRRRDVLLRPDLVDDLASCSGGSSARARARESCFGSQTTPPLAPPNGMPISAHFHVIHIDERLDLVERDVRVVADAALRRARARRCA